MTEYDYDFFVIGGGSGGVRAARTAAGHGVRVGLADPAPLGGTCVNAGCIPKKLYSLSAHFSEAFEESEGFGWSLTTQPTFHWETLKRNRASEIRRLNGIYDGLLQRCAVDVHAHRAEILDAHTVKVGSRSFRSRHILLATGSRSHVLEIPGKEHLLTSDEMFDLPQFPTRLLVIGAGYIACEFASIFRGLGAAVTQVHRGSTILAGFDQDVQAFIAGEMRTAGIDLRLTSSVVEVHKEEGQYVVRLADGSHLEADAVLCATGRLPRSGGIGLEASGVALTERGGIRVDAHYRSSVPSIHAIGDVSSPLQLTPVALAEAMVLVDHLFGNGRQRLDYELIPTAVFTHPNVACVGLTEAQARQRHPHVSIYRSTFRALKYALTDRRTQTLVKLVVDGQSRRVLGLHMVGADAGEVVQGFAVALRAGATKEDFDATVGIHPTVAEEFVTLRTPLTV